MTPLLPKNQISSNKRLRHISPGGLQSSRMCPAGWGISALCIKPIHQLLGEKKRPRALLTPSKVRGGKRFPPASSSPGQRSCWKMVSSGRRGEGKAALSSRGFPWWGSTVAGYSLRDGAYRCPGHPCPAKCHLGWGGLLNHSMQAGDAKLTQHPTQTPGVPGTDCTP